MLLTEVHGVALVAVHEVDHGCSVDRRSTLEKSAKIGLVGLGSKKCVLVKGSGNG